VYLRYHGHSSANVCELARACVPMPPDMVATLPSVRLPITALRCDRMSSVKRHMVGPIMQAIVCQGQMTKGRSGLFGCP
jgi:hypothetical protein